VNALSWFKEWARRSQTADVLAGVSEQARANLSGVTNTLVRQGEEREALDTKIAGQLDIENIQQAGLNDRETIQERTKTAERAAKFNEEGSKTIGAVVDDANHFVDADAFLAMAQSRGISAEVAEPIAANIRARVAAEKAKGQKDDPALNDTLQILNRTDTAQGIRDVVSQMPENLKQDPRVAMAIGSALQNAAFKEREAADVRRKRWSKDPPAPKTPHEMTTAEFIAAGKAVEGLEASIEYAPDKRDDIEFQIKHLKNQMRSAAAQKATQGRPTDEDGDPQRAAVLAGILKIVEGIKNRQAK